MTNEKKVLLRQKSTYRYRVRLREVGAIWDKVQKTWIVDDTPETRGLIEEIEKAEKLLSYQARPTRTAPQPRRHTDPSGSSEGLSTHCPDCGAVLIVSLSKG